MSVSKEDQDKLGQACGIIFFAPPITAFVFWFCWTVCGLGYKFFSFLPMVYLEPGFWECVGLVYICSVFRSTIVPSRLS